MAVLSLFDRLTDEEPGKTREVKLPEWEIVRRHRDSVARDLMNLLNVRKGGDDIPEACRLARETLPGYGLLDFGSGPVDRELLRRSIEQAVSTFEPRLKNVMVEVDDSEVLTLSFRITATLRNDDGSGEPIVFEAEAPTDSRRFKVEPER